MNYKASIICITYNHEATVETCIASIIKNADPENTEIIVHDDYSLDNTRERIEKSLLNWGGAVRRIYPKKNRRSQGEVFLTELISLAKGDVVFIIEGDDYWTTSSAKRVPIMARELLQNEDLSLIFSDTLKVDTVNNKISWILKDQLKRDLSPVELRHVNYSAIHLGACCFRNRKFQFPPEFYASTCKDIWFPLLWSKFGAARYTARAGSLVYRFNGKGVWSGANDVERARRKQVLGHQLMSYFIKSGDKSAMKANLWRVSSPLAAL